MSKAAAAAAWSSDSDRDDDANSDTQAVASGYTGVELRRRLLRYANAEPSDGRGVAAALEGISKNDAVKRQSASAGHGDKAGETLLTALEDDELLDLRAEVITQLRGELIVVSEVEAKASMAMQSCRFDREDLVRSMTAMVVQQNQNAAKSISTLRQCAETLGRLKESFQGVDKMISSMQSARNYHSLRKMHYFKRNNEAVLRWCEVLTLIHDEDSFKQRIDAGELVPVYRDLHMLQSIREELGDASAIYRGQINQLMPSFEAANQVIEAFIEKIEYVLSDACTTALTEYDRQQEGDDDEDGEEEVEEEVEEERAEGEEPGPPKLSRKAVADAFALLPAALEVVDLEQGHDGDKLKFAGRYPLQDDVLDSPLSVEGVESIMRDGARQYCLSVLIGNGDNQIQALCVAFDKAEDTFQHVDEVMVTVRCKVPLARILITQMHETLIEEVEHHVAAAENGEAVEQNDLLDLRRSFNEYLEKNVLDGNIVSQYTEVDGIDGLQSRLLAAATDVLQDYLIRVCTLASKVIIQDQAIEGHTGARELEPDHSEAALNVIKNIIETVKGVTDDAPYEVLHKLAVAIAAAISAFVKDQVRRLDYRNFVLAVKEAERKYNEIMNPKPVKGQPPPQPPEVPPPLPLTADQMDLVWVTLVSGAVNGFVNLEKQLRPLDKYFGPMYTADEIDLTNAGALPPDFVPGEEQVKWVSPFMQVLDDMPKVADHFISRLVKFIAEISLKSTVVEMLTSEAWCAGIEGQPKSGKFVSDLPQLTQIEGMLEQAVTDLAEPLPEAHRATFRGRVAMYSSTIYIEQVLKYYLSSGKKWYFSPHVARDVDRFAHMWAQTAEHDPAASKVLLGAKNAINAFSTLLNCTTGTAFLNVLDTVFTREFQDAPDFLFEILLGNRPDMDRSTKTQAETLWRAKWQSRNRAALKTPSLFSLLDETVIREKKAGGAGWFSGGAKPQDDTPSLSKRAVGGVDEYASPLLDDSNIPTVKVQRKVGSVMSSRAKAAQKAVTTVSLADLLAGKAS